VLIALTVIYTGLFSIFRFRGESMKVREVHHTGVIVLAALGMIAYKYHDYMKYPWTRDGLVRAQVVQIVPRVSGALVRVPIRNNQLVKKGDLLFEIDPSTFQANVHLARAERDNMRDIVKPPPG
jgi:multidrug resistance efflux pump